MIIKKISKILTKNDTGETHSHQAGILVPKSKAEILSFFPELQNNEKNPRKNVVFLDKNGKIWKFNYIYYNNKFFGGTRNEYRLTGMTKFFRKYDVLEGDLVVFSCDSENNYYIEFDKKQPSGISDPKNITPNKIKIKLKKEWKIINLKGGI